MEYLQNFLVAFVFSFVGSIPPGTINLTVLQLGLAQKRAIALRFALAASLMEYPYAWIAVEFQELITSSPLFLDNLRLIGGTVMLVIGGFNLWSANRPTALAQRFQDSGFRRGLIIGALNPMVLPFWIAVTAFAKIDGWIVLNNGYQLQSYLVGIMGGVLVLLVLVDYMAKKIVVAYQPGSRVKLIPGIILVVLGVYAFIQYFF